MPRPIPHSSPNRRAAIPAAVLVLGIVLVVALVLARGSGANPDTVVGAQSETTIPAGFDLFVTDPEQTVFQFSDETAIPAGFFGPGSESFEGDVPLAGEPIGPFREADAGDADTVVERQAAASVPEDGSSSKPVPIELVRLSLIGVGPIQVKVGDRVEAWDVRAAESPTRPSRGEITIARTSELGGTADLQLTFYPQFTFTRISDGERRVLDVGALPDDLRPNITFTAKGTPWRAGCVPPTFAIAGLNDGFCAGLTPGGVKTLTLVEARRVAHGIWPVQPRPEHFQCYSLKQTQFKPRAVQLRDQFGKRTVKVLRPGELCNPVRKSKDPPIVNRRDHLRCYATGRRPPLLRAVQLRNQFGPFAALVLRPQRLCLPSSKQLPPKKPPRKRPVLTDHYQCYGIKPLGAYALRSLTLRDQFGTRAAKVRRPYRLCVPVRKNKTPVQHPVHHLVCYLTNPAPLRQRLAVVRNQFGQDVVRTRRALDVCVPSVKLAHSPPALAQRR